MLKKEKTISLFTENPAWKFSFFDVERLHFIGTRGIHSKLGAKQLNW